MLCIDCNLTPRIPLNKRCRTCINLAYKERAKIIGSKAWYNLKRVNLKKGAKQRGILFELNCADMKLLHERTTGNCPYCEKPMDYEGELATKPTIERVDNEQGYTIDNCIVICWQCNKSKGNLTKTQIRNIYRYLFG